MKVQISVIAVLCIFFVSCFNTPPTEYKVGNDEVSLMVTSKTTEEELNDIAEEFRKKKNIEIDFEESTFKGNGKIKQLELKVNCNDGHAGSASFNVSELRLRPAGFIRNYKANGKTPFTIGSIFE